MEDLHIFQSTFHKAEDLYNRNRWLSQKLASINPSTKAKISFSPRLKLRLYSHFPLFPGCMSDFYRFVSYFFACCLFHFHWLYPFCLFPLGTPTHLLCYLTSTLNLSQQFRIDSQGYSTNTTTYFINNILLANRRTVRGLCILEEKCSSVSGWSVKTIRNLSNKVGLHQCLVFFEHSV